MVTNIGAMLTGGAKSHRGIVLLCVFVRFVRLVCGYSPDPDVLIDTSQAYAKISVHLAVTQQAVTVYFVLLHCVCDSRVVCLRRA